MNDSLQHYGVPGMKWGVRRSRLQSTNTKIKKAKKEQREWDQIAKTSSTKRFLGNKSPAENANSMAKSYGNKINKLAYKKANLEVKGKRIADKLLVAKTAKLEWKKAAKDASTKRFLGNKSSADICNDMVKSLDRDIAKLKKKQARIG